VDENLLNQTIQLVDDILVNPATKLSDESLVNLATKFSDDSEAAIGALDTMVNLENDIANVDCDE